MKNRKNNQALLILLILIVAVAFLRVFIGIPNVTPIAAIALFGATYIKRRELALVLPLAILFISDLFIGLYSPVLMLSVYGSFILIALIGFAMRKKVNIYSVIGGSISASVVFFLVTNFIVWAEGLWYPLTVEGLVSCYAMALPFFRYELIGTLAFTLFFFGSYSLITRKVLAPQNA
jgi:hypothetical protein